MRPSTICVPTKSRRLDLSNETLARPVHTRSMLSTVVRCGPICGHRTLSRGRLLWIGCDYWDRARSRRGLSTVALVGAEPEGIGRTMSAVEKFLSGLQDLFSGFRLFWGLILLIACSAWGSSSKRPTTKPLPSIGTHCGTPQRHLSTSAGALIPEPADPPRRQLCEAIGIAATKRDGP